MVVRLARRLLQLGDSDLGRGKIGIPEAEVDDILTGAPQLEGELADHREHVRRKRIDAAKGPSHVPPHLGDPLPAARQSSTERALTCPRS